MPLTDHKNITIDPNRKAYNDEKGKKFPLDFSKGEHMSRTYRRKNIEDTLGSSWDRRGRKYAGFDTICDRYWDGTFSVRERTEREKFDFWYWLHGESRSNNERTPNRWYRQRRCRQGRRYSKRELQKFLRDENYEPMANDKDLPHGWDWR